MCRAVFLASDRPLPTIPWDKNNPDFHVTDPNSWGREGQQLLSLAHIYYVGSHQGCGCGFQKDFENDEAEQQHRKLADYLRRALSSGVVVELLSYWPDDSVKRPPELPTIRPGDLEESSFDFPNSDALFVRVVPDLHQSY